MTFYASRYICHIYLPSLYSFHCLSVCVSVHVVYMCQDFIGSDVKNWRGVIIALLVIAAICGVILIVILIVTPGNQIWGRGLAFLCV